MGSHHKMPSMYQHLDPQLLCIFGINTHYFGIVTHVVFIAKGSPGILSEIHCPSREEPAAGPCRNCEHVAPGIPWGIP